MNQNHAPEPEAIDQPDQPAAGEGPQESSGHEDLINDAVEKLVLEIQAKRGQRLNKQALAQALLVRFGGYQAIAKLIYELYKTSKKGSSTRSNIVRMIVNCIASERIQDEANPLLDLKPDQLRSLMRHALNNFRE